MEPLIEIILLVLAYVCAISGLAGSILPILPGPPISYATLIFLYFCDSAEISIWTLVIMGILMVVITILDYVAPAWMTKLEGGSKYSTYGALIGLIVGLIFVGPLGMIFGPFVGAFIGELIAQPSGVKAFRVAFMSLIAFVVTSGIKLLYGMIISIILLVATIRMFMAYF